MERDIFDEKLVSTESRFAFTMAEILLSLTIIGVVAAITLPSLTGNINERTWNTQRKALYSRMSQAISLMPALNGYGTSNLDTAAETFVTSGLAKVLKINNICGSEDLNSCGVISKYTNMGAEKKDIKTTLHDLNGTFSLVKVDTTEGDTTSFGVANTKVAAFETQNGESIVVYYNPYCHTEYLSETTKVGSTSYSDYYGFPQRSMCVNFIYDLNGKKGPNTVGKDIGAITVFNATDSIVVAPLPSANAVPTTDKVNLAGANTACKGESEESRVPNIHELSAMFFNKELFDLKALGSAYWSTSRVSGFANVAWVLDMTLGIRRSCGITGSRYIRCVKR